MKITAPAADAIRDLLRRSDIPHPAIYLAQVSEPPAPLADAAKRGAGDAEIRQIAAKTLPKQPKYLYPLLYPRSHFLWLTTTIDGLPFAPRVFHVPAARRAMKGGSLHIADRGFVLKAADGTVVLPESVARAP